MPVTRIAIGLAVALLGFFCWLAADGVTVAYELLVSFGVLVVLVAGGNWLGDRRTPDIEPYRPPVGPSSGIGAPVSPGPEAAGAAGLETPAGVAGAEATAGVAAAEATAGVAGSETPGSAGPDDPSGPDGQEAAPGSDGTEVPADSGGAQ